jgi:anti-anti-sigma factor
MSNEKKKPAQISFEGGTALIFLNVSRLDWITSKEIEDSLKEHFDSSLWDTQIEMGKVRFIDSLGIRILLEIYRRMQKPNSKVSLLNVHPSIKPVMEMMGIHRVFSIN